MIFTLDQLMNAKLIGHPSAKKRRDRLGELLQIGQVNSKGLKKRLEMFRITPEQFDEVIATLDQEEQEK